jgi:hypothetical protein
VKMFSFYLAKIAVHLGVIPPCTEDSFAGKVSLLSRFVHFFRRQFYEIQIATSIKKLPRS